MDLSRAFMSLAEAGDVKPVNSLHPYPFTNLYRAFRLIHSDKGSGKIVLEVDKSPVVLVNVSASSIIQRSPEHCANYSLDPTKISHWAQASYVVAGGLVRSR